MRKLTIGIAAILLLSSVSPFTVQTSNDKPKTNRPLTPVELAMVNTLTERLVELKGIDRSALTIQERREWKKELREIEKNLKRSGNGGVYLSLGAIIIIVLLLIIIL